LIFPLAVGILIFGLLKDFDWYRFDGLFSNSLFLFRLSQTLLLGTLTSLFVYLFLVLLAFSWKQGFWEKFFLRYSGPTPVLTAFAFLLLFPTVHFGFMVQAVFALTVVSLPLFMKTDFLSSLKKLQSQREIAVVLGANSLSSFLLVVWPQIHPVLMRISAYVGIWSMGDFAISRILATNDRTLALYVNSLVSNYRLNESVHFAVLLLGLMMIYFLVWKGIGHVVGQKLSQTLWRLYT
jgi:ABC-type Fe3+ transport system permease subunit